MIRRANRSRRSGGVIAASLSPPPVPGYTLWLSADRTTNTGNGSPCSSQTDLSGNKISVVEGGAGLGPLRRDANGRRPRYVEYSNGKYATASSPLLNNIVTGAGTDHTVVYVFQPTAAATGYHVCWGNTSNTARYEALRRGSNTLKEQTIQRDNTQNNSSGTITESVINHLTPQVNIVTYDIAGATAQFRIDGNDQTAIALPRGTNTIDIWGEGAFLAGAAPTLSSAQLRRHLIIYNRKLTTAEKQAIEAWAAPQMGPVGIGWKSGYTSSSSFGNGSNAWLVIVIIGQSNGSGRDPDLYTSSAPNVYCLYADGNLAVATEPTVDNSNAMTGQATDPGATPAGTSPMLRCAEYLRNHGETRNIMIVNRCAGGTLSSTWNNSVSTDPAPYNGFYGIAVHHIAEALNAPNSELMVIVDQGESNADTAPHAAAWPTDWGTILDDLKTRFASHIVKTKWAVIKKLSPTPAVGFEAFWQTVRDNQDTFANTTRTDCTMVQAVDGPWLAADNTHLTKAGEVAMGDLYGAAIAGAA